MPAEGIVSVIGGVMLIALGVVILLYGCELASYARFLGRRPPESNGRLVVGFPLPGCKALVRAINAQLDEEAAQEQRRRREEAELFQGLAGLSHDIRTPLAGAKGYLQLAMADPGAVGNEARQDMLMAQHRLDSMQGLLDQLFDYMGSLNDGDDSGDGAVDVVGVLAEVLAENYPAFAERTWEPVVSLGDEPLLFPVGEEALQRIFENVVANMLKHGTGDMKVERKGGVVIFANAVDASTVIDASAVFEPFYRGDSARSVPGAGLGLPVVKRLCDQAGIDVSATVDDNTFIMVFDFSKGAVI